MSPPAHSQVHACLYCSTPTASSHLSVTSHCTHDPFHLGGAASWACPAVAPSRLVAMTHAVMLGMVWHWDQVHGKWAAKDVGMHLLVMSTL